MLKPSFRTPSCPSQTAHTPLVPHGSFLPIVLTLSAAVAQTGATTVQYTKCLATNRNCDSNLKLSQDSFNAAGCEGGDADPRLDGDWHQATLGHRIRASPAGGPPHEMNESSMYSYSTVDYRALIVEQP